MSLPMLDIDLLINLSAQKVKASTKQNVQSFLKLTNCRTDIIIYKFIGKTNNNNCAKY